METLYKIFDRGLDSAYNNLKNYYIMRRKSPFETVKNKYKKQICN